MLLSAISLVTPSLVTPIVAQHIISQRCFSDRMSSANQIVAYISTIPGAVRLSCVILNFISGVCMASSWATNTSYGSFFNFTSWMGLILSIFIFIAQSLEVYQRPAFRQYPWKAIELGYSGLWSFFYLVASCCIANLWHATAATIFGFFTCALYVGLTYLSYQAWRTGQDTVDNIYSEYDTSGVSYQNSDPSYGSRPGTDPHLPAPHHQGGTDMMDSPNLGVKMVPSLTITSTANTARLELVD